MNRLIRFFTLILFVFASALQADAQKNQEKAPNFKEGTIKYEIEVEGAPSLSPFMKGTTLSVYFKDNMTKTDVAVMAGVFRVQLISDVEDHLHTLLMDVPTMSEKTAVPFDEDGNLFEELSQQASKQNKAPSSVEQKIKYTKKKKRIAKYKCQRVEISVGGQNTFVVYVTDKLRPAAPSQLQGLFGAELKGYPMAVEMEMDNMKLNITAKEVSKKEISESLFVVPKDYSEKTMEELKDQIQEKLGMKEAGIGL